MPVAESDEVKKTFNWPQAVSLRLQELDNELKDEEVTKKGFYNRKYAIVQEYLVKDQVDKVVEIKASFKEGNLTDTEYYKKMDELLIPSQEFVDDGASAEEEDKENQPLFPVKDEKEEKMETEEAASGSGSSSKVKEESSSSKVKEESSSSSGKALRPRPEKNQRSITDMFKNAPKKRTLENEDSAESEAKKIKVAKIQRCKICRQDTCNPDLLCYETHPDGAKEEMEAIFDPKILLESEDGIGDQMPNYKITSFTVYCKEGHVVRFDTDLIENGKDLYFSGFIKAVWSEDPTVDDESVPVKDAGPITSWWNAGYDGGDKPVTGFSTVYAEYYLMSPSDLYKPIMTETDEKIFLTKHVIEYLEKCVDPAGALGQEYEDMTNYLSVQVPKEGMGELNEEMLIKHADFVVHQVYSYEDAGDEEGQEVKFLPLPCVKDLIKLAGIKLSGRKKALRMKKPATKMMPKHTDATVTPAVRQVFEMVFGDQMRKEDDKAVKKARMQRCGMCENCLKSDCGKCRHCLDMTKFGGSGRSKQACMERKCLNKGIKGEDAEESDEEEPEPEISPSKKESEKVTHKSRDTHKDVEWVGSGAKEGRKTYYTSAILDGNLTICIGDTVLIQPDQSSIPLYIAKVSNMYDGPDGATAHVQWFGRGMDTILGEAGDPSELFLLTDCEDQPLLSIWKKCNVQHLPRADQADWRKEGGQEPREVMKDDGVNFWYRFHYTPTTARFTYPDPWPQNPDCDSCPSFCGVCIQKQLDEDRWLPKVHEKTETLDIASLFWDQAPLKIGDCVYLSPNSVPLKIKKNRDVKETSIKKNVDEDLYPEYYRKRSHVKGNNNTTPDPFHVVMIKKIFKDCGEVKLRVQIFYRPEDTHKGSSAADNAYYNELYWTEEEATVAFSNVQGRCFVKFMDMNVANKQLEVWTEEGPNRWFFREWYNLDTKDTEEPPLSAQRIGHKGKGGKGGKGKGKSSAPKTEENVDKKDTETSPDYPPVAEPLKCLDIFSGCGGLSQGLHESGVAESKWAVEIFEPAAKAYKLNNKDCTVFGDDCNLLLARAIEGVGQNEKGQKIPTQGEVDLLCGGPPCQGFSGMNRFNSREYSQFKNSLVSTYLSYCDYYRPKYFILENVKNFASYKKGMVLKLCLTTLIKMGYQCSFAVLQAGQFGVAQTRRRAIILAAAPGEKLPLFPEPQHVFSPQACSLSVQIDEVRYESNVRWTSSAPYRTCTVRDTMSDLPKIGNGEDKLERSYGGEAKSHFQKNIRKGSEVLRDHITKNMAPLIVARFELIPTAPGSDWRDLPNKVVKLSDDITKGPVKKLRYMFDDKMQGRGPNGQLRGVCSCADGKTKCEAVDKQDRTLIPWCLPHTGNRHNHWAGLYGRVEWDGFFSTTITNPEPMGKQGRVLHPDQHRVVSVRECARSQGFPDTYRFYGSVLDKHRQIGNAVPPPMGRALGLQIRQAMAMSK